MNKLLLLVPVLALTACGPKSYTYEAFYDVEGTGKAEVSVSVPGGNSYTETVDLPVRNRGMLANALGKITVKVKSDNQVTCKLRVEKEKEIARSGEETTCEYEITEDTDN
ncbi:hypothetical protein [Lentzea flava]|uniref:Lipoprotein n=1 Tax=Lentzea flava TaxID=103732 RepID=A0ABQ2UJ31_9PSEU|nr:hypothetical protein [Lentzea flava]MCP2199427.1 hypothetical protein [Lentzea flava]GGU35245.1 hypothetical protein GCM10010178_29310 [Lentzea flava]